MNDGSRNDTPAPLPMRERLRAYAAQAILEAAEQVFAEQGLQAGMDAIASRAGVAVGTLYKHFTDRDGLVQAIVDARFQELLAATDAALDANAALPFEAQLEGVLGAIAGVVEKHAAFRRMAFQAELPPSHAHRQALGEAIAVRLDGVLARGREQGLLPADPDRVHPVLILGLLHATLSLCLRAPARMPPDRIAAVVTRQFLHGAAARPA